MRLNYLKAQTSLDNDTFRKLENRVWYEGSEAMLVAFYRNTNKDVEYMGVDENINLFYRNAGKNSVYRMPILHFDLPKMITKAMVNLTFNEIPKFKVSHKVKTKQANNLESVLNDIYKENNDDTLFHNAAELLSYSGAIAFKLVIDEEFSQHPIIQVYPKEDFSVIKKYNRVIEIIFEDYYEDGEDEYVLKSNYGKGFIKYTLLKIDEENKMTEVPLSTLDELKGLENIEFDKDKKQYDKNILAVYLENKTNAQSDYHGCTSDFQTIDEYYSNEVNFIRKTKPKTYYPESLCSKDSYGNKMIKNEYDTDNVIVYDSGKDDTNLKVERDIVDIMNNITGYSVAIQDRISQCLRTTGLSMITLGYSDASANSSGAALEIRETMTARTRSEKNKRWSEALSTLSKLLLSIEMRNEKSVLDLADMSDFNFTVEFAEYVRPTAEAITELLASQLNAGLIDRKTALIQLYPELSEEEIEEMLINIEKESYNSAPSYDEDDSDEDSNDMLLTSEENDEEDEENE